jgi:2-polyprenyl-3-methyl-5-hydroxy-6-metoxy-1,4-benzoquinol methylase
VGDFLTMAGIKQDKASWERAYQQGLWDILSSDAEYAHNLVVGGFVGRRAKPYSLLDVGCGSGVILRYLDPAMLTQYTGVDLTEAALARIEPKRPQDRYICSSLEEFNPDEKWDVILFNEVLYYTRDPVASLRKFEKCLHPGGSFVVSMHKKASPFAYNNRCIRRVRDYFRQARYSLMDAVEICKITSATRWQVFLVQPPSL